MSKVDLLRGEHFTMKFSSYVDHLQEIYETADVNAYGEFPGFR